MMRRGLRGANLVAVALLAGCGNEAVQVSASGFGAFEPSLAASDGGLAVAWNDNRHGNDEIYLRLLDDDLQPMSAELRLTESPELSYEAALAVFAGNFAVAWYDRDPSGHLAVKLGLWGRDGSALWSTRVSTPALDGRIPVLQPAGDELFIAWVEDAPDASEDSALWGASVDVAGGWRREPFAIAPASRTTWNINAAALGNERLALVYDAAFETAANELYLALVADAGIQVTRLGSDDGFESKYPDIALRDGSGALAWFDVKDGNEEVYLAPLDPLAPPQAAIDGQAQRITQTSGESIGAYLAWNGDTLGLAWNDNASGQHEIHFRSFNRALRPLGAERQLTRTVPDSLIPSIVAHGKGFALAWNEVILGGGHDGDMSATRSEIAVIAVE